MKQRRRAQQRGRELAAMLNAGGFTGPGDGCDDMIRCADDAYMCLLMVNSRSQTPRRGAR